MEPWEPKNHKKMSKAARRDFNAKRGGAKTGDGQAPWPRPATWFDLNLERIRGCRAEGVGADANCQDGNLYSIHNKKTMTLTKHELIMRISGETGLVQTQIYEVVQKTLDYIADALAKGDKVELRNFGVFDVKIRKSRVGRNPHRPEMDVPIPSRAIVKFKAGKEMRVEVLKLSPQAGNRELEAVE
jgi:nucleoid DNA-binding protein